MVSNSTGVALLNVMKAVGAVGLIAFAAMLVTPMGPDSPRMLPFLVVAWFCGAVVLALGLAYLLIGRADGR